MSTIEATFIDPLSPLGVNRTASIFDPIKKKTLANFTSMNKIKTCKVNSKVIPLQASKNLFAKIALVAQIRSLNLRQVFKFPLGPMPWSLAEPLGTLKKTSKAELLHKPEGTVEPIVNVSGKYALIINGMAFVQQAQVSNKTFGQLAMDLLERILKAGMKASRIDVVVDEYRNKLIKNIERSRRSRGELVFKRIVASAEIKQWRSYLSSNENKNSLVAFIVSEWKKKEHRSKILHKDLFVTDGSRTYIVNSQEVREEVQLESNHEEADTRMLLHAKHASSNDIKILISSPNTDVFIICLSVHLLIDAELFFLTGVKFLRKIIDVDKISDYTYEDLNSCEISKDIVMKSLKGFHSFTGCDTISAFVGRGKVKPIKLMLKDIKYIKMFSRLGANTNISTEILHSLTEFVCHMYGWKRYDSVDEYHYRMYCQRVEKFHVNTYPHVSRF